MQMEFSIRYENIISFHAYIFSQSDVGGGETENERLMLRPGRTGGIPVILKLK